MHNKTILFISFSAHTLGGVQIWLDYILPGLDRLGWRAVLGLVAGHHHNAVHYLEVHPYDDVLFIENPTGSSEGRINGLINSIESVRPDIVLSVNIVDVYSAISRMKRKKRNCPKVVATLHGIQADYVRDFSLFSETIDTVICTNRLAQHIVREETGIELGRVLYAPYGVDLPVYEGGRKRSDYVLKIAYVGRLEEKQKRVKDIPLIMEQLMSENLNVELFVAGDGPEMSWFENEIANKGLGAAVKILGTLDQKQLNDQVYKEVDLLLITSSWETGPIVAWEAMSHGVAVVSSKYVGSGREGSLRHGDSCFLFEIGDIDGAVECLKRAAKKKERERVVTAGRALVEERYSKKASINAWDACLKRVIELPVKLDGKQHDVRSGTTNRLDAIFGYSMAEFVRKKLGRTYRHAGAGGEWPHTYSNDYDNSDFLKRAKKLDRI